MTKVLYVKEIRDIETILRSSDTSLREKESATKILCGSALSTKAADEVSSCNHILDFLVMNSERVKVESPSGRLIKIIKDLVRETKETDEYSTFSDEELTSLEIGVRDVRSYCLSQTCSECPIYKNLGSSTKDRCLNSNSYEFRRDLVRGIIHGIKVSRANYADVNCRSEINKTEEETKMENRGIEAKVEMEAYRIEDGKIVKYNVAEPGYYTFCTEKRTVKCGSVEHEGVSMLKIDGEMRFSYLKPELKVTDPRESNLALAVEISKFNLKIDSGLFSFVENLEMSRKRDALAKDLNNAPKDITYELVWEEEAK